MLNQKELNNIDFLGVRVVLVLRYKMFLRYDEYDTTIIFKTKLGNRTTFDNVLLVR